MDAVAMVFQPSTLRMLICPEARKAQNCMSSEHFGQLANEALIPQLPEAWLEFTRQEHASKLLATCGRNPRARARGFITKDQTSQGPRVFTRSKATCAAPLCEVLTPCRGQRPHHVQRDRIGTWEVSGLTGTARRRCRPASGR